MNIQSLMKAVKTHQLFAVWCVYKDARGVYEGYAKNEQYAKDSREFRMTPNMKEAKLFQNYDDARHLFKNTNFENDNYKFYIITLNLSIAHIDDES